MFVRPIIALMLLTLLSGCGLFECFVPANGIPPEGLWAGGQWNVTIQPDGTAYVEGSCASGAVFEPIELVDGHFSFTVSLTSDISEPSTEPYDAYFEGNICGDLMEGNVEANGATGSFTARLGDPSRLSRCQTSSIPLPQ